MTRTSFAEVFPELAALEQRDAAYREGYELGYRVGHERGREDGIAEESHAWHKVMGIYRRAVARPTYRELQQRRGET